MSFPSCRYIDLPLPDMDPSHLSSVFFLHYMAMNYHSHLCNKCIRDHQKRSKVVGVQVLNRVSQSMNLYILASFHSRIHYIRIHSE